MAKKCDLTGKKTRTGGQRKHQRGSSGGGGVWANKAQRTLRKWRPNLRKTRLINLTTGNIETLKISMKAYKKLRKGANLKGYRLPSK